MTYRFTLLAATVLLAGCNLFSSGGDADSSSSSSAPAMMESSRTATSSSAAAGQVRVIEITTSNWAFAPNSISVKKGEKVTVRLRGDAGIHGFAVRGTNVRVKVEPGEIIDVELPTDTEGTFEFFCNVPCGAGHKDMKGTLTVTA